MKKLILGALLAGLTLFLWGAISHEALPLGWLLAGLVLAHFCRQ